MRAALYLGAVLLSWYMAGMYRSAALMVLFVSEVLLALVLFVQPRLGRRSFRVVLRPMEGAARRGAAFPCRVRVEGGCASVSLRLRYPRLDVPPTRRRLRWGGTEELDFSLTAPYCGLMEVEMVRVRRYDPLWLFSVRGRAGETLRIPVLPPERTLRVELASPGMDGEEDTARLFQSGDGQSFRQLREYRAGDPVRRIHWNQSARSHIIWFKEHEREEEPSIEVLLNTGRSAPAALWSAFFEVLSALVRGLLQAGAEVRVTWLEEGAETFLARTVQDAGELTELLTALCLTGFSRTGDAFRAQANRRLLELGDRLMELDLDLVLRQSGVRLCAFTPGDLDRQLDGEVLLL